MFTWNCPEDTEDLEQWNPQPKDLFKDMYVYLIYQWEMGTNLHIQGYVYLKKPIRLTTLKKLDTRIHWEVRKGTHAQAKHYCSKPHDKGGCHVLKCHQDQKCLCTVCDEERKSPTVISNTLEVDGDDSIIPNGQGERSDLNRCKELIQTQPDWEKAVQQELFSDWIRYSKSLKEYAQEYKESIFRKKWKEENVQLRLWQRGALMKLSQQNDRQIDWFVDQKGNSGKTWLAKWLVTNQDAFYMVNGKSADVAHAYNGQKIVIFDFTRDYKEFINYSIIEQFKNGLIFKSKYESKMMFVEPCKILVFSNWVPDMEKLSRDRWNIHSIDDEHRRDVFI